MALTHVVESRVARCGRPGVKEVMRDEAGTVAGDKFSRLCLPRHSLTKSNMIQDCLLLQRKMKKIKGLLIKPIYC